MRLSSYGVIKEGTIRILPFRSTYRADAQETSVLLETPGINRSTFGFDSNDDPSQGRKEGMKFNGYKKQTISIPCSVSHL